MDAKAAHISVSLRVRSFPATLSAATTPVCSLNHQADTMPEVPSAACWPVIAVFTWAAVSVTDQNLTPVSTPTNGACAEMATGPVAGVARALIPMVTGSDEAVTCSGDEPVAVAAGCAWPSTYIVSVAV